MVCIDQEVTYGPRCTHKNTICGPLKNKQGHLHEKMKKIMDSGLVVEI